MKENKICKLKLSLNTLLRHELYKNTSNLKYIINDISLIVWDIEISIKQKIQLYEK